jgi:hypothetical protein
LWLSQYSDSATGWTSGIRFLAGAGFISTCIVSRPDLGLTQPPIQCVPRTLSPGVKCLCREDRRSPPSSTEVEFVCGLCLQSPTRLRGVVLNKAMNMYSWRDALLREKFTFTGTHTHKHTRTHTQQSVCSGLSVRATIQLRTFITHTHIINHHWTLCHRRPLHLGKVRVKLFLCLNWAPRHEDVWGSGGIPPRILDLVSRWR